jgi:CRP/FNR family transcriptional regulator, cyclic AMP receptor protein
MGRPAVSDVPRFTSEATGARLDLGLVSLLEAEPDLADGLRAAELAAAERATVVRTCTLRPGERWGQQVDGASMGVFIITGLVSRRICVGARSSIELLGAGDLFFPCHSGGPSYLTVPLESSWTVLEPAWLAVLDHTLALRTARWPSIMGRLVGRAAQRADSLAMRLAIAQIPQLSSRLLVLLWHLADRWGRVDPDGIVLSLRLSHATLAELVCAQRPSVTNALRELTRRRLVERLPGGGWHLHPLPSAELAAAMGAGVADSSGPHAAVSRRTAQAPAR